MATNPKPVKPSINPRSPDFTDCFSPVFGKSWLALVLVSCGRELVDPLVLVDADVLVLIVSEASVLVDIDVLTDPLVLIVSEASVLVEAYALALIDTETLVLVEADVLANILALVEADVLTDILIESDLIILSISRLGSGLTISGTPVLVTTELLALIEADMLADVLVLVDADSDAD